MTGRRELVVIGNGLVGHKLIELLLEGGHQGEWHITTFCEEPRLAYDRVNLSSFFNGKTAADLSLVEPGFYEEHGISVHLGDRAVSIDRGAKTVGSARGRTVRYDKLALATGSPPRARPRPRRLHRGHRAARRARAHRPARPRRAREHRGGQALPHPRPGHLRHRRVRELPGPLVRTGRAGLPDGARRRRRPDFGQRG